MVEEPSRSELADAYKTLPSAALLHAWEELTQEELEFCIKRAPGSALGPARARLTPAQVKACMKKDPYNALRYMGAEMDQKTFDLLVAESPAGAIDHMSIRLTPDQLEAATKAEPYRKVPTQKESRIRIEHITDEKTTLIDLADNFEDALDLASCHCENIPEKELRIVDPEGNILA